MRRGLEPMDARNGTCPTGALPYFGTPWNVTLESFQHARTFSRLDA